MQGVFSGRLFTTRGGALAVGGVAAVLAAALLFAYLRAYRSSVRSGTAPATVLVAKQLIPKGTSGSLIGQKELYQVTTLPKDQVSNGAFADPAALRGQVSTTDVYPGQQLTLADFSAVASGSIPTQISGAQRAMSVPLDSAHGLIGQLHDGDHVDVYVSFGQGGTTTLKPVLKLLLANVTVLNAPTSTSGGLTTSASANVVLRVPASKAAEFAFAADNGKLWFALRPQVGAKKTPPSVANTLSVLSDFQGYTQAQVAAALRATQEGK
ncbi:MAG TPA: Flp pilus assembly protein CpaB [Gaiellaceae bacterium]